MLKPNILNYPDIMHACQAIADRVGDSCKVAATLIMQQNAGDLEVLISSLSSDTRCHCEDSGSLGSEAYSAAVIKTQQDLHLSDAHSHKIWAKNSGLKFGMSAYYGTPLNWPDGTVFGAFCLLKAQSEEFSQAHIKIIDEFSTVLETLLKQVMNQEQLRSLAEHDSLTQTYSRGTLLEKLQHEFDRFQRYDTNLSVIYLDVDHFKNINDNYGHGTGDLALTLIAKQLTNNQRQTDFIGRLGGEEFLICLSDTELAAAKLQAERILKLIANIEISMATDILSLTASCGVAQANKNDKSIEKLIARADTALYLAKETGRNKTVCAPSS